MKMARGLQIITPYNQSYTGPSSPNDIIIVQTQDYLDNLSQIRNDSLPRGMDSQEDEESRNDFSRSTPSSTPSVEEETITGDESLSSTENQVVPEDTVNNNENCQSQRQALSNEDRPSASTASSNDFLSTLANHFEGRQPSLEETRAAGQVLFKQFVQQYISREMSSSSIDLEIMEDAIPEEVPEEINRVMHNTATVNGYPHPKLSAFGRDLRKIAEKFEKSQERQDIRRKAEQVDLDGIRYDDFKSLLFNFFEDGSISRSRIIVLFFFCSDLARRAVMNGTLSLCRQLFTWSVAFIMGSVCSWVQKQGGWGVVLGDYIPKLAVTLCAVAGFAAFLVYIKKNL